jgi:hypothetical protein
MAENAPKFRDNKIILESKLMLGRLAWSKLRDLSGEPSTTKIASTSPTLELAIFETRSSNRGIDASFLNTGTTIETV